jgi:Tat protein translocase TatB subunit
MFGLGAGELVLVVVIALVVFGPEKIPEIARWLGKTSAELRRMSDSVRREFYNGLYVPPREPSAKEARATSLVAEPAKGSTGSRADLPASDHSSPPSSVGDS